MMHTQDRLDQLRDEENQRDLLEWRKRAETAEAMVDDVKTQIRELEWQIWRQLKEGEMTRSGDQFLDPDEDAKWKLVTDAQCKHPASDPRFPAHVKYRRRIADELREEVARLQKLDDLARDADLLPQFRTQELNQLFA